MDVTMTNGYFCHGSNDTNPNFRYFCLSHFVSGQFAPKCLFFFSLSSMVQVYIHQTSPLHCHLQTDLKHFFLFHYTRANQGLGTKLKQQFCPKPSKWNLKMLCRNQLMNGWGHSLWSEHLPVFERLQWNFVHPINVKCRFFCVAWFMFSLQNYVP